MNLIVNFPHQDSPFRRRSFTRPPRASVSFSELAEVIDVENLSLKYKNDIWFSGQEMRNFRRQTALFLLQLSSANMSQAQYAVQTIESDKDSSNFMGLESCLTRESSQNIADRKIAVRGAIMQEQARQLDLGINDPDRLALIAEHLSAVSAERARIIGLLHASEKS